MSDCEIISDYVLNIMILISFVIGFYVFRNLKMKRIKDRTERTFNSDIGIMGNFDNDTKVCDDIHLK